MDAGWYSGKRTLLNARRRTCLFAIGFAVVVVAAGFAFQAIAGYVRSENLWAGQQQYGAIRFGIDPTIVPVSFYDSSGWTGMDADVALEICKRVHLRVESDPVGYDAQYDALFVGRVDVLISALIQESSRSREALFTQGYFEAGLSALYLNGYVAPFDSGSAPQIFAGRRIAVELGSGGDLYLRRLLRRGVGVDKVLVGSTAAGVALVRSGSVEFVLADGLDAAQFTTSDLATSVVASDPYVLAVRSDQQRLRVEMDKALATMRADGTLERIAHKWLAPDRALGNRDVDFVHGSFYSMGQPD